MLKDDQVFYSCKKLAGKWFSLSFGKNKISDKYIMYIVIFRHIFHPGVQCKLLFGEISCTDTIVDNVYSNYNFDIIITFF